MGCTVRFINHRTGRDSLLPAPRGTQSEFISSEMITRMLQMGRDDYKDAIPSVEIELIGQDKVLRVSEPGDEVYIMNDAGATVEFWRYDEDFAPITDGNGG